MLSYSSLREIQKREMESAAIVKLEDAFYKDVAELLAKKKEEAMAAQSIMAIKEFENTRKTIVGIQAKREEKIVLMSLRGEKEGNGLTPEEKEFLYRLSETVLQMRETVKGLWNNEPGQSLRILKVRITQPVEKYTGLDKNIYGPYKPGEQPVLPKDEAEWLLNARMAESV